MLLALFLLLQDSPTDSLATTKTVTIPRIEATAVVDGRLDDAGVATGHPPERLLPIPAGRQQAGGRDHRGAGLVRADGGLLRHRGARPGARCRVRATVADRDNLDADDRVTIYLDTFNDRRRAFFFTVNPLGVQEDGVRSEGGFTAGSLTGGTTDKNPDYLLGIERASHGLGLCRRDPHPVQEPALSGKRRPVVGTQHPAPGAAHRI